MSLEVALDFLETQVRPRAQLIDQSPEELRLAFAGLAERGLMGLRCPVVFGGPGWPDTDFRRFQLEVARTSGTLAFLQTQQQRSVSMIASMAPPDRAERMLTGTSTNQQTIGLAVSQLRREGPPLLTAERVDGGLLIQGKMPWITGFGFFEKMLVGAMLPDGTTVFARTDFAESENLRLSEPMDLAAMQAAMTVSGVATGLFIAEDEIIGTQPPDWIHENDRLNVTLQAYFALGCSRAAVDLLESNPVGHQFLSAWERLESAVAEQGLPIPEKLRVRAHAIEFMGRATHAALIAHGGRSISMDHPAQRLVREAMVFSVSAITKDVQRTVLEALAGTLESGESPNTLRQTKIRA